MLHCSHTFPHKHIMRCIFGVLCCICSFLCRIFCTHSYSELQLPCSHRVGRSSGASRPAAYHSTPTQSHCHTGQIYPYFIYEINTKEKKHHRINKNQYIQNIMVICILLKVCTCTSPGSLEKSMEYSKAYQI